MLVFRDLEARLYDPAKHAAAKSFLNCLTSLGFDPRLCMPGLTAA
jgi:hypothetical protein